MIIHSPVTCTCKNMNKWEFKKKREKTVYSHSNSAYDKKQLWYIYKLLIKLYELFINHITMHSCKKENDYHSFKKYWFL